MFTNPRIAISWHRLPPYAARLICAGVKVIGEPVSIIASEPPVFVDEVEQILGQHVHWIDPAQICSWSDLGISTPEIYFQSGWFSQAFINLGREVRKSGGRVVCLSDNSWKNSPRQWLGAVVFRIHHRQNFHSVWVPGCSGFRLCRFFGMPVDRIYQGLYSADPEIFFPGVPLAKREKKFIFVGQLIDRKGITLLIKAFSKFRKINPEWTLHVIGNGPLVHLLNSPGITVEGFKPPDYVASILKQSRFLILPSHEEHWGLVVHEAALSGCGLIVSKAVGSSFDLVSSSNGTIFTTASVKSLYQALLNAASLSHAELNHIFSESQRSASRFNPQIWAETFKRIIADSRTRIQPELERG